VCVCFALICDHGDFFCRAIIGEVDEEVDADIDFDKIRAPPMKEVTH
jgi:hypothetical protein